MICEDSLLSSMLFHICLVIFSLSLPVAFLLYLFFPCFLTIPTDEALNESKAIKMQKLFYESILFKCCYVLVHNFFDFSCLLAN